MKGQPDDVCDAIVTTMKNAQTEFRHHSADNIFINPKQIKKRLYCEYEVLEILERYGHCALPEGTKDLDELQLSQHRVDYGVEDWRLTNQGRKSAETEATTSATASTGSSSSSSNGDVYNRRDDDASNFNRSSCVSSTLFAKKQSNQASAAGNCGRRGRTLSARKSLQSPKTRPQLPLVPTFLKDGDAINMVDLPKTTPKRRHASQKKGGNDDHKSSSLETNFLLQSCGNAFTRAGQGIGRLHENLSLKPLNANDARKSIETYLGGQDDKVRDKVTNFLCHSKNVRDEHFTTNPRRHKAEALLTIKALHQTYKGTDSRELLYSPLDSYQPSAASTSTAAEAAATPKQKPSSTPTKADVTTTKKSSPLKKTTTPATPNTVLKEKTTQVWDNAVKEAQSQELLARAYSPGDVLSFCKLNNIPCKVEQALKINRRLRDYQHKARCNSKADRLLRSHAKRMKIHVTKVTSDFIEKLKFKDDDLVYPVGQKNTTLGKHG